LTDIVESLGSGVQLQADSRGVRPNHMLVCVSSMNLSFQSSPRCPSFTEAGTAVRSYHAQGVGSKDLPLVLGHVRQQVQSLTIGCLVSQLLDTSSMTTNLVIDRVVDSMKVGIIACM
jgi:hypothetical protein